MLASRAQQVSSEQQQQQQQQQQQRRARERNQQALRESQRRTVESPTTSNRASGTSRRAPESTPTPYRDGGNATCTGVTGPCLLNIESPPTWCYLQCCICNPLCGLLPCCSQSLYTVNQDELAIVSSNGKFSRAAPAGPLLLSRPCMVPIENIVGRLSTRVQQLEVTNETKTKDNAIITIKLAVQFQLMSHDSTQVEAAWYRPDNSDINRVISAQTADIVRTRLAKISVDEAFLARSELQHDIAAVLREKVEGLYGYKILAVLVIDFEPAPVIKASMNDIYVQNMNKIASQERAESLKIIDVVKAQALAQRIHLLGEGTARQREAIASGLASTTLEFCSALNSVDTSTTWTRDDVLYLQVLMQQLDAFKSVARKEATAGAVKQEKKTLILSTGPLAVQEMQRGITIGQSSSGGEPAARRKARRSPSSSRGSSRSRSPSLSRAKSPSASTKSASSTRMSRASRTSFASSNSAASSSSSSKYPHMSVARPKPPVGSGPQVRPERARASKSSSRLNSKER